VQLEVVVGVPGLPWLKSKNATPAALTLSPTRKRDDVNRDNAHASRGRARTRTTVCSGCGGSFHT
jgi:hypothetical protein